MINPPLIISPKSSTTTVYVGETYLMNFKPPNLLDSMIISKQIKPENIGIEIQVSTVGSFEDFLTETFYIKYQDSFLFKKTNEAKMIFVRARFYLNNFEKSEKQYMLSIVGDTYFNTVFIVKNKVRTDETKEKIEIQSEPNNTSKVNSKPVQNPKLQKPKETLPVIDQNYLEMQKQTIEKKQEVQKQEMETQKPKTMKEQISLALKSKTTWITLLIIVVLIIIFLVIKKKKE